MFIPELPTAFARHEEALELQASAQDSLQVISYPDERWSDMSQSRGLDLHDQRKCCPEFEGHQ